MRPATRLLASVRTGKKFLEPGTPTGLTGLLAHPAPRSTLVYLYNSTLNKLKAFPESSVYRQSTEALTRQRLNIVESTKPEGFEAWQQRVQKQIDNLSPSDKEMLSDPSLIRSSLEEDHEDKEWGGAPILPPFLEGTRTAEEREAHDKAVKRAIGKPKPTVELEPEPALTTEQISQLENQIGAGLIEEVIQVAHQEHNLIDTMQADRVWEELVEKAPEGQWSYFERGAHTSTQKP